MNTNFKNIQWFTVKTGVINGICFKVQFDAIKSMLKKIEQIPIDFNNELCKLEQKCIKQGGNDNFIEHISDKSYELQFWDLSYSMTAVGLLAPFMESFITNFFKHYSSEILKINEGDSKREKVFISKQWDPHMYIDAKIIKTDFVKGALQLFKQIGINTYLPKNTYKILQALFRYRNKMVHNGYEWPKEKCEIFEKEIKENNWQAWFDSSGTKGNVPDLFFMNKKYINECIVLGDNFFDAFANFVSK